MDKLTRLLHRFTIHLDGIWSYQMKRYCIKVGEGLQSLTVLFLWPLNEPLISCVSFYVVCQVAQLYSYRSAAQTNEKLALMRVLALLAAHRTRWLKWRVFFWYQSATCLLDATKFSTLDLQVGSQQLEEQDLPVLMPADRFTQKSHVLRKKELK